MSKSFYLEDVPDDLWRDFVNSFPRSQSINDKLIEMIEDEVADAQIDGAPGPAASTSSPSSGS